MEEARASEGGRASGCSREGAPMRPLEEKPEALRNWVLGMEDAVCCVSRSMLSVIKPRWCFRFPVTANGWRAS